MKKYIAAAIALGLIVGITISVLHKPAPVEQIPVTVEVPKKHTEKITSSVLVELNDPDGTADDDVRILHYLVINMLTAIKDPYKPPLGINEDFVTAFTGGNRYGDVYIPADHVAIREGQLIDRWGTPYHFHARAPNAIDVRSAGPDLTLFTDDDVVAGQPPNSEFAISSADTTATM